MNSAGGWLRFDMIVGVTLITVAIPEVMGYTTIAQTPIVTGLYTAIFPTIVFALSGSSRQFLEFLSAGWVSDRGRLILHAIPPRDTRWSLT